MRRFIIWDATRREVPVTGVGRFVTLDGETYILGDGFGAVGNVVPTCYDDADKVCQEAGQEDGEFSDASYCDETACGIGGVAQSVEQRTFNRR